MKADRGRSLPRGFQMVEEVEVVLLGLAVPVRVEITRDLATVGIEVGDRLVVVQLRVARLEDSDELVGGDAEPDGDEGVKFDEGGSAFVLRAEGVVYSQFGLRPEARGFRQGQLALAQSS